MKRTLLFSAIAMLLAIFPKASHADLITHTDRASWEAAVGTFSVEDFNSIVTDQLLSTPTAFSGFTFQGDNGTTFDAPPVDSLYNVDGTTFARSFGSGSSTFEFDLNAPTSSFGVDLSQAHSIVITAFNGATNLGSTTGISTSFGGVHFDEGETFNRITITTFSDNMGLDNVSFSSVPEPGSLAVFGLCCASALLRRQKRS